MGLPAEGDSHKFGAEAVEGGGLDVEAEGLLFSKLSEELLELFGIIGDSVVVLNLDRKSVV